MPGHRFGSRGDIAAAALLAILALTLNFAQLAHKSIWLDEATSIGLARLGVRELLSVLPRDDLNMGLYYLLLARWVKSFGESEFAVRSLSASFAVLAVLATYLVGTRLFGRTAGFVAGLLLALNSLVVNQAQNARGYSLVLFLVTVSSYCFVVLLERPSLGVWTGYVLASVLSVYSHYFAALVLLAHAVTLLAMRGRATLSRGWLLVAAAIGMLSVPAAVTAYRHGPSGISWIESPALHQIPQILTGLAGGSPLVLVLMLASGAWAITVAMRERQLWRPGFVAAWLLVPVAVSYAVSLVQPVFLAHYLIICTPALALLAAAAVVRIRRRVLAAALVALMAGLSANELRSHYGREGTENWREATGYVLAGERPGDGLVFFPWWTKTPFEYYQRRAGVAGPLNLTGQPRAEDGPQRMAEDGPQRIWLVIRSGEGASYHSRLQQLRATLAGRTRIAERRQFAGVEVELHVR